MSRRPGGVCSQYRQSAAASRSRPRPGDAGLARPPVSCDALLSFPLRRSSRREDARRRRDRRARPTRGAAASRSAGSPCGRSAAIRNARTTWPRSAPRPSPGTWPTWARWPAPARASTGCWPAPTALLVPRPASLPRTSTTVGHRALIAAARASGVEALRLRLRATAGSPEHPVDFFRTKHAIEQVLAASRPRRRRPSPDRLHGAARRTCSTARRCSRRARRS